jgi:aldose 1-epimerase
MRIIEIASGSAQVRIAPELGGAITAFTASDTPILRPTPDAVLVARDVRRTACYPLIPYSNRIRNAHLRFAGRDYVLIRNFGTSPHAIHGVGWQRPWTVDEASAQHALLSLRHDARGDAAGAWPWPFHATQAFHLAEAARADATVSAVLVVTLTLANIGVESFPFGLGWHPFFPKTPATRLAFGADFVWRNDATQMPEERIRIPDKWRFDPSRALDAITLDNVFTGWRGAATVSDSARELTTTLRADRACSFVVVYAPPGSDFVAVEPVTHETDAFNRAAAGASGTGMRILPPGAAFSCTMRIAAAASAGPVSSRTP